MFSYHYGHFKSQLIVITDTASPMHIIKMKTFYVVQLLSTSIVTFIKMYLFHLQLGIFVSH